MIFYHPWTFIQGSIIIILTAKYYQVNVRILGDPYKILIQPPRTHYVRLSRRVLGIFGSIMIDQTNVAESKFIGDF